MLSVTRVLCEALRESVDEGKRHGVSRFISDDLPESVIQGLRVSKCATKLVSGFAGFCVG